MNGVLDSETDYSSQYVEVDPTGRYGRYDDVLGKGASKTVYKGFDEYQGIEVAWNQVKLHDFLRNPEDLERLYCEIHLLKTLKHKNIMKFHASWVDASNRNINFVTEMFTSGTLRQFRLKHRKVNVRAVKQWCRQILRGLVYLHSHDPPVIHRDLKCDNIFVNGNQGEVKIGDLGLAGFLSKSHADHCVGTPEFMAPEVYEEEYNELVDIYSFGMCILEMVTLEYPYSECTTPAQIYKKVISEIKPEALYKVKDEEVREFVGKCLATMPNRLSAKALLKDRFLQIEDYETFTREADDIADFEEVGQLLRQSLHRIQRSCDFSSNGSGNRIGFALEKDDGIESSEIDLFSHHEDDHVGDVDITIKGRRREDDGIFLRLRIVDKEGRVRNIYFPFVLEIDTGLSVASEMVAELDITDQDVTKIAEMINGEISNLVPDWKTELSGDSNITSLCHNCASNSSASDYISPHNPCSKTLQVLRCSKDGCTSVHGRFEEIMYQVEGSEKCLEENSNQAPERSANYADIWAQRDGPELKLEKKSEKVGETIDGEEKQAEINEEDSFSSNQSLSFGFSDDHENEIRQELRWLKAKYQMQLRELKNQQLRATTKFSNLNRDLRDSTFDDRGRPFIDSDDKDDSNDAFKLEFRTSKSFYTGALNSLHRAISLPVDAVNV